MDRLRIICQPFHDWRKSSREGFRTRDAHILLEMLSRKDVRQVTVVNRPISPTERALKRLKVSLPLLRAKVQASEPRAKLRVVDTGVPEFFSPLTMRRDWWRHSLEHDVLQDFLQGEVNREGAYDASILWNPMATPIWRAATRLKVFDAIDNWLDHPEITDQRGYIEDGYREICRSADVIFVNSDAMSEFFMRRGRDTEFLPNAAPTSFMDAPLWATETGDRKITVGYFGKLAKRIDVLLLKYLAAARPDWQFELAGPVLDPEWLKPLRRRPNVKFLGDVQHGDLPSLVQGWHVATIPHNVGELENGGDPIKLYEYLALGVPVVTTPIAEVNRFAGVIHIARSPATFLESLEAAITYPGEPAVRRASVIGQTWSNRTDAMLSRLRELDA
jgi:teichuronic acid biosynthesis glycosyltransferase TuaH